MSSDLAGLQPTQGERRRLRWVTTNRCLARAAGFIAGGNVSVVVPLRIESHEGCSRNDSWRALPGQECGAHLNTDHTFDFRHLAFQNRRIAEAEKAAREKDLTIADPDHYPRGAEPLVVCISDLHHNDYRVVNSDSRAVSNMTDTTGWVTRRSTEMA
jgi:hypothetical protein